MLGLEVARLLSAQCVSRSVEFHGKETLPASPVSQKQNCAQHSVTLQLEDRDYCFLSLLPVLTGLQVR